jgi:parvulin-like peptidyl-prolyl isomerase
MTKKEKAIKPKKKEERTRKIPKSHDKKETPPVEVTSMHPTGRIYGNGLSLNSKLLLVALVGIALLLFFTFKIDSFSMFDGTDDVILTVNGVEITEEEIEAEIAKLPAYYLNAGLDEETLRTGVIEQLIAKVLIGERVNNLGIKVSQEDVQTVIEGLMLQSGLSEDALMQYLIEQGFTEESFEEVITEQVAINKVIEQEVLTNIAVTEEEIINYFNTFQDSLYQVRASHILICYNGMTRCEQSRTQDQALNVASEIIVMVKEGQDFASLALEYSDDVSVEFNQGDLGWFSQGQMVPEFEQAAFSLNAGEMATEPVQTDYGYHVIYVTDKKSSIDETREDIIATLTVDKQTVALEEYISLLRNEADIVFS